MAVFLPSSSGEAITVTVPSASTTSFSSVKATDLRDGLRDVGGA
jgi:hypothetical protein